MTEPIEQRARLGFFIVGCGRSGTTLLRRLLCDWDGGSFASSSSRAQMLTPHVQVCNSRATDPCTDPSPWSSGYRWMLGKDLPSDRSVMFHEGGIAGGFGAMNEHFPDQRVTIILLCNSRTTYRRFVNSSAVPTLKSVLFPK